MITRKAVAPAKRFGELTGCLLIALTLASCGPLAGEVGPSDQPNQTTGPSIAPESLESRTLRLPSIDPNGFCPVSPQVTLPRIGIRLNKMPDYGFGDGPVYLSGQLAWHRSEVAMLLVSPTYAGPALARGHQLDGGGGYPFDEPAGDSALVHSAQRNEWRTFGSPIVQTVSPGCYGVQVDGTSFSEVIIFLIQPGPPPGG